MADSRSRSGLLWLLCAVLVCGCTATPIPIPTNEGGASTDGPVADTLSDRNTNLPLEDGEAYEPEGIPPPGGDHYGPVEAGPVEDGGWPAEAGPAEAGSVEGGPAEVGPADADVGGEGGLPCG